MDVNNDNDTRIIKKYFLIDYKQFDLRFEKQFRNPNIILYYIIKNVLVLYLNFIVLRSNNKNDKKILDRCFNNRFYVKIINIV